MSVYFNVSNEAFKQCRPRSDGSCGNHLREPSDLCLHCLTKWLQMTKADILCFIGALRDNKCNGQDSHEMHARLRSSNNYLALQNRYNLIALLADETAEPRPDMNIKIISFKVSKKSFI